ncbi:MAG: PAS domain-containing sensor histidine kinase [Candidatus Omnitrophica bacterium]|nr:PAS domain-containing sensor histidine kinase [Candidatus Omnitrophota bacterium]
MSRMKKYNRQSQKGKEKLAIFKLISDSAKYGLAIVNMKYELVYLNNSFARIFGYSKSFLLGKNIKLLHSQEQFKWAKSMLNKIKKQGYLIDQEIPCIRKDGTELIVSMNADLIKDENGSPYLMAATVIDVTEKKNQARFLKEERKQLLSIFDSIDEVIYVADPHSYEILYVNKFCRKLLGKKTKIEGGICYREFQNFNEPCYFCTNEIILKNPARPYKWEYHNPHVGRDYYIVDRIIKWPDGRDVRFEIAIDVTERKKAEKLLLKYSEDLEEEIKNRTDELMEAQRKLEKSKRLSDIGMLAATIAHELNNPLNVMRIAVYNIKQEKSLSSLDVHLANIEKKILQSSMIIKNLLGYASVRKPCYENVKIVDLVNECIENCLKKYRDYSVKIIRKFDINSGYTILADALYILELTTNILENAFQSFVNKSGKLTISIKCNAKKYLELTFKDNGTGIKDKDLNNIFEPFFTRKASGIGLGLTVCRQIVNLHKGRISIKSQEGFGTKVSISIPAGF